MIAMLRPQHRTIIADRYGLWDGIAETLQDIQLAQMALAEIARQAHYTEIAAKIREMWPERRPFNEIGLLGRLNSARETFVWQANGTYALVTWGLKKPPYIKDRLIVILTATKYPMSYRYLEQKVLEVCRCKLQSVRMTLDLNPQVFRKFPDDQYGLRSHYS
jgi:hypothetical protein